MAAVTQNGDVYIWGDNSHKQIGTGIGALNETIRFKPYLLNQSLYFMKHKITQVECGKYFTLALDDNGSVYSWGESNHGELGHGSRVNVQKPSLIRNISHKVKQIACGHHHSVALSHDGIVYSWGSGKNGRYKYLFALFTP
jgi:alpha-tubulin suppressor-like RCC1 family protein